MSFPTPHRTSYTVLNQTFQVDSSYEVTKELGSGAYGSVAAALHKASGESVAIKKITNVFTKKILAKRALREIKLLRHLRGHKNITCLYDMDIIDPVGFNEVYLYEELMEADLHAIVSNHSRGTWANIPFLTSFLLFTSRFDPDNLYLMRIFSLSSIKHYAVFVIFTVPAFYIEI